jgi:hypothetical protein
MFFGLPEFRLSKNPAYSTGGVRVCGNGGTIMAIASCFECFAL